MTPAPIEALCQFISALERENLPGPVTVKVPFRTYQAIVSALPRGAAWPIVEVDPPRSLRRLAALNIGRTQVTLEEDLP